MTMKVILFGILVAEILIIIWWKYEGIRVSARTTSQLETDLRLTYKRYREIYPNSTLDYSEYKRLQARKAYKRAVSPTKIKRMVR